MSTALAPRIGYDNASAIAKAAYREGKTIREIAIELVGLDARGGGGPAGPAGLGRSLEKRGASPSRRDRAAA